MKFTTVPNNFAPLSEGVVYRLDCEGVQPSVDIDIIDDGTDETVAVCRFTETAGATIDIAPYLRRMFDVQPVQHPSTSVREDCGRTVAVRLEAGGAAAPVRRFTSFALTDREGFLPIRTAERTIAFGEFDEVPVYAPNGGRIVLNISGATEEQRIFELAADEDVRNFILDMTDIPAGTECITACFEGVSCTESIRWRVARRMPEAMRLAWESPSGAVEYYTFPTRRSAVLTVEKSRCYGVDGYRTAATEAETAVELVSDFEPAREIASLEEIIAAPRVWIVEGAVCRAADVVSTTSTRHFDGGPDCVTVVVREARREVRL